MRGYWLARSGRRVLFVEKGRSTLPRGARHDSLFDAEVAELPASRSVEAYYDALARAGRSTDEVEDISRRFSRRFVPFIGSGTGGRAIYGLVCERFLFAIPPPGRTFATRAIPLCRMPGRLPTSKCGPGAQRVRSCWGSRPARSPAAGGGRG
jgi:hypothetical protein